jgi:hypothetical protein
METKLDNTTESQHDAKLPVSCSDFDFENNFITCKCEGDIELCSPHLGGHGYDWCNRCKLPLGSEHYS